MTIFVVVVKIIYAFFTGLFAGVAASAPVGPCGLESAKRHLQHGMRGGLLVGFGSNLADLLYLFLTILGLTQFSHRPRSVDALFWLVCGLMVVGLGIKLLFQRKPIIQIIPVEKTPTPVLRCFLTGFLICLVNPATPVIWLGVSSSVLVLWQSTGVYFYCVIAGIVTGVLVGFPVQNLLIRHGMYRLDMTNRWFNASLGILLLIVGCIFSIRGFEQLF